MDARARSRLLLSSSVAALLIGGGAPAARAACADTVTGNSAGFTNPTGQTIPCVTFDAATVSGNVVNAGTIAPGGPTGILVTGASTIAGQLSNAGAISITTGTGIRVTANSVIADGIVNSGTIAFANGTSRAIGIKVDALSTFAGGITNSGTIAGPGNTSATRTGILVVAVSTFSGGIANIGSISGLGAGIVVTGSASETFLDGISNSGSISVAGLAGGKGGKGGFSKSDAILVNNLAVFSGGIANIGTLAATRSAVNVRSVTSFAGGISNGGAILAGARGVFVDSVATFMDGIANSGTISAGGGAISVDQVSTFVGGISNVGTITAAQTGIGLTNISTFAGRIANSGTISGNIGIGVGFVPNSFGVTQFEVASVATFTGGVTNSGSITAGSAAIWVMAAGSFAGGITNAAGGVITAPNGIRVGFGQTSSGAYTVSNFSGGITNHGQITASHAVSSIGIGVNSVSTFAGRINNSGTIVAPSGAGIVIAEVGTFSGGISNSGAILGDGFARKSQGNIYVGSVGVFDGGITNSGTIAAGQVNGILVEFVNSFSGGISNSGSIQADAIRTKRLGVIHVDVDVFDGGITNASSGTLTGVRGGIYVSGGTFLGGITNGGRITAQSGTGIIVENVASFGGHIANSGTISAGGPAINLTGAGTAITIDQNAGLIAGNILLSPFGDTLNVRGGTINGNVVGQSNGDTVNFALGSGSFTFAAPFAMTGLTLVNFDSGTAFVDGSITATTLAVNSGGTAAGIGTLAGAVTVMAGGTLMPGDVATPLGTLNVTGSLTFNPGSFYSVHVSQATASATTIGGGGGAAISGGVVKVTLLQAGSYNQTSTIVTANGGRTGTFSGLVNTNAAFNGTESLSYDATHVFLTLDGTATLGSVPLVAPGPLSANPQNVLNGINTFIAPGNVLPPGFQNLYNSSGPALTNALTQLSGESKAGFSKGAFQAGNSFLGLMVNPFLDGRFGNGGGFGAAIGFAAEEPPALPQAAAAFASAMPVKAAPAPATFEQRFSAWGAAYGGSGRVLGDPIVGSHDTSASAAAFAAGIDYRLSPDTLVGFALAGGGTSWNVTAGLGGGRSDMFQAGAYASHHWGAAYLSGALAYNFHDVTTNRTITIAGTDMLQARFNTNGVGARLEGGYRYATPWLGVTPYAAAQVQSIALPSYGETATAGSNQFALNFAAQTATATRSELGAWLDKKVLMQGGALLTLYGRAAWAHDFGNNPRASAIFQSLPGSNFVVDGAVPARDGALVTGAARVSLAGGWSFLAKFDGEFSSTTSIYSGSGMVTKTW
jgi:outer membrane autotransporter protein